MPTATHKPSPTTLELRSPTGDGRGQTKGKQHPSRSPETLPATQRRRPPQRQKRAQAASAADATKGRAGRGSDRAGADHNNQRQGATTTGTPPQGGVGAAANGEAESNAEGGKKAERKPARSPRLQAPARSTQGGRRKPPRACAGASRAKPAADRRGGEAARAKEQKPQASILD